MKKNLFVLAFCCFLFGAASGARTEGLWLFEESAPGETVVAALNSTDGAACTGFPKKVVGSLSQDAYGREPVYSDDCPARTIYSDSTRRYRLTANAQSVRFFSGDPDIALRTKLDEISGGALEFKGLATHLSKLGSYTIEMWQKEDVHLSVWCNIFFADAAQPYRWSLSSALDRHCLQHDQSNQNNLRYFETRDHASGVWHHIAVVYDDNAKIMKGYIDWQEVGTIAITNEALTGVKSLWLGAQNTRRMAYSGKIACMRLSRGCLAPADFMATGDASSVVLPGSPMALYPFKDGKAGTDVACVTNMVDKTVFPGVSATFTDTSKKDRPGVCPVFSQDAPGACVYASSRLDERLIAQPGSVRFSTYEDTQKSGGRIDLQGLAYTLYDYDAFTIEFFFKLEQPYAWCSPLSIKYGSPFKVSLPANYDYQIQIQRELDRFGNLASLYHNRSGDASYMDGAWHHVALVYTNNIMRFFVDYEAVQGSTSGNQFGCIIQSNRYSEVTSPNMPVVLGAGTSAKSEAFPGMLSCVRVTPSRLDIEDFMVARDTFENVATVFHWPFEAECGVRASVSSNSLSSAQTRYGYAFSGEESALPVFTNGVPQSRQLVCTNGVRIAENKSCLYFGAMEDDVVCTPRQIRTVYLPDNGLYAEGAVLHPASFTWEGSFKVDGSPAQPVLLFGRGESVYGYDWRVGLAADGALLAGVRMQGEEESFSLEGDYADGEWHQLVVVYDDARKTFKLYADGTRVLDETLSKPMLQSKGAWCMAGGCGMGSFTGFMDEVRLSARALTVDAFLKFETRGGLLFSIR